MNRREFNKSTVAGAVSAVLRSRPVWARRPRGFATPSIVPPSGLPQIGMNFEGLVGYFDPEQPFLNILNNACGNNHYVPWFSTIGGIGGSSNGQEALWWPLLDSNYYPTTMSAAALSAAGIAAGAILWVWALDINDSSTPGTPPNYPTGNYTLQGYGAGTMYLAGDPTTIASTSPYISISGGTITSSAPANTVWTLTFQISTTTTGIKWGIGATDPLAVGNYIQNCAIVQSQYLANYNAGEWFNPMFKAAIAQGNLPMGRFMDWLNIDGSIAVSGYLQLGSGYIPTLTAQPSVGATTATLSGAWPLPTASNYTITLANGQQITGCTCTYNATGITFGQPVSSAPFLGNTEWSQPSTNIMVSTIKSWADRPLPSNAFWTTAKGCAIEVPIQLCNEMYAQYGLKMHCWMPVPCCASNAYVTSMAQLVFAGTGSPVTGFEGLNPNLVWHEESHNETWNPGLPYINGYIYQAYQGYQLMSAESTNITTIQQNYNGVRAANVAALIAGVYGAAFSTQVACHVSGQAADTAIMATAMAAPLYVAAGGTAPWLQTATAPATGKLLTRGHIAPYFPNGVTGFTEADWNVLAAQSDGGLAYFFQSMTSNVMTGGSNTGYTLTSITGSNASAGWFGMAGAVPSVAAHIAAMVAYGSIPIDCYESGQSFIAGSYDTAAQAALMTTANQDPRMQGVYTSFYQQLIAAGAQYCNCFTFCSSANDAGSGENWGCFANLMEYNATVANEPPKWQAVVGMNGTLAGTFDYYISTSGSDTNSGSLASPWALTSLLSSSGNQSKMVGKRIGVIAGTYNVMTLLSIGSYPGNEVMPPLLFVPGGNALNQTYIASCNSVGVYAPVGNSSGSWAILNGQGNSTNNSFGQTLFGSFGSQSAYVTIDGFEITGAYYHALAMGYNIGGTYDATRVAGVVLKNNYIHAVTNNISAENPTGITLYTCTGALVHNNYITNITDNFSRATCIETWNCDNCTIEYNTNIGSSSQPGGIFIKNQGNYQNTVRFNHVDLTAAGTAVNGVGCYNADLWGTAQNVTQWYGNIGIGNMAVWNNIVDIDPTTSVEQQLWYNNTFVGIPGSGDANVSRCSDGQCITWYNNICSSSSSNYGQLVTNISSLVLSDFNLYNALKLGTMPNGDYHIEGGSTLSYTSIASWTATLSPAPTGADTHSITTAPTFAGGSPTYPSQAYQLTNTSAGKGVGSSTGLAGGNPVDMGAWGLGQQPGCNFVP
jgi:hypothetical protein